MIKFSGINETGCSCGGGCFLYMGSPLQGSGEAEAGQFEILFRRLICHSATQITKASFIQMKGKRYGGE